jgi:ABC-2 type transport system ATP-binding protein
MNELHDDQAISVERLVKRYRGADTDAVAGLSFAVASGEVYGLLGPNGSGKSTTVAAIATLSRPTAGRVRVLGRDVVEEPEAVRLRIGVALQDAGVDPEQTGIELLTLHARLLGRRRTEARRRAGDLLDELGLGDAVHRRVRTWSGGMRRRLDLAVALVGEPDVVVLDEPTTGLDPASRAAMWDRIRGLRDAGTTVLMTTQYLEEADRLADRVGIIAAGVLRAEGPPEVLKRRIGGDVLAIEVDAGEAIDAAAVVGGRPEGPARVVLEVEDGGAAVPRALAALGDAGVQARSVSLRRPTLDDVFLEVTGDRLAAAPAPRQEVAA